MRKFTFLFVLIGLSFLGYGQKPLRLVDELKPRDERNTNNVQTRSKGISVEITAANKYIAGTTMDLKFSLFLDSPDFEYGDYFEMTFPDGIRPIDGSDPIQADADYPEYLNGTNGQVISWGDNDNSWGGIQPGTIVFYVTVEIESTVIDEQTITWKMSGDLYGNSQPHEITGSVPIEELPDVPDLRVTASGFIAEYYSVPFDQIKEFSQVTSTIQAIIINEGAELNDATYANVSATNDYADEQSISLPLLSYMEDLVVFNQFKADKVGTETFTFSANASNDFNTENGTFTKSIEISETDLIRDNGDIIGLFSVGSGGGDYLGNVFTINSADTLNSVTIYLGSPTIGDVLSVDVFEVLNNGTIGEKIAGSIQFVITSKEGQEYTAYFAGEGIILEPGKYLFAVKEDVNSMTLAITSNQFIDGSAWVFYEGIWQDMGAMGFPFTFYIRPGFGTEIPLFDIALQKLDIYKYVIKGDELIIKGTLLNSSIEALTTIDINYTVNNGNTVSETITDVDPYGLIEFSLTTPIELATSGDYNINVYISNPNGNNDANLINDTLNILVSALEYAPHKNILGEEATGTWCGWCVRGHVYMDYMAEKYPETWIGIAVHNYDPMVVDEYDAAIGDYISGYPSGLVNRAEGEFDPMEFEDAYLKMIALPSPVDVTISDVNANTTTKELTFTVNVGILATLNDARFNAVIVENNVAGDGSGYNQANYYSGGANGEMGGYEDLPNPVLAEDMVYQNVARAILGGWNGTEESIPAQVNAGVSKSYTYTVTLNETWNIDELVIVGMIISEDGSVLNSTRTPVIAENVTITFNVDMTSYSGFNPPAEKVYVEGSFGTEKVELSSTDNIHYTGTVSVLPNTAYTYKYSTTNVTEADNREVIVAGVDIAVNDDFRTVGVEDNKLSSVKLFPNPFRNTLTISNIEGATSITVSSVLGQAVMTLTEINTTSVELSTSELQNGVYFITITDNNNNSRIERIVKQ